MESQACLTAFCVLFTKWFVFWVEICVTHSYHVEL